MSQMTMTQCLSRMPPEVAAEFLRFARRVAEKTATPSMPGGYTLTWVSERHCRYDSSIVLGVQFVREIPSEKIPTDTAPASGCEPASQSIHEGSADEPITRWGIS